ncbi:MAG: hypothetical protein AAGU11_09385 [Syntrophobacteraceae bacterium]
MDHEHMEISRRTALKKLSFIACAVPIAVALGAEASEGKKKATKAHADYQDQPKGDQKCANCVYFIADKKACERVEGEISPNGWSHYWKAK